ncbi:uncharacterized protein SCDLUD_004872 [Saccharomycodes ludwigii]|uniref:uncharacterized protein n=1 Tax=Saccharomycodes ludwigii TaxID=36035 RepID=UPI001E85677C|nr:hypothetical protein SCDLUD_004872 [Saccharomycodes ludwigii]KAH3899429.1 hypothetical protein SCDLUD_004872 [Saccharomycodes ludwigii]
MRFSNLLISSILFVLNILVFSKTSGAAYIEDPDTTKWIASINDQFSSRNIVDYYISDKKKPFNFKKTSGDMISASILPMLFGSDGISSEVFDSSTDTISVISEDIAEIYYLFKYNESVDTAVNEDFDLDTGFSLTSVKDDLKELLFQLEKLPTKIKSQDIGFLRIYNNILDNEKDILKDLKHDLYRLKKKTHRLTKESDTKFRTHIKKLKAIMEALQTDNIGSTLEIPDSIKYTSTKNEEIIGEIVGKFIGVKIEPYLKDNDINGALTAISDIFSDIGFVLTCVATLISFCLITQGIFLPLCLAAIAATGVAGLTLILRVIKNLKLIGIA